MDYINDAKVYIPCKYKDVEPGVYDIVTIGHVTDIGYNEVEILYNNSIIEVNIFIFDWKIDIKFPVLVYNGFNGIPKMKDTIMKDELYCINPSEMTVKEFVDFCGSIKNAYQRAYIMEWAISFENDKVKEKRFIKSIEKKIK